MDDMLDALADKQRRALLAALTDHEPQDDVLSISDGSDKADDEMDYLIRMRHVHVPKLTKYGFIDWNESAHEVTKGPNFEEIRPLLESLDDHEDGLPPN